MAVLNLTVELELLKGELGNPPNVKGERHLGRPTRKGLQNLQGHFRAKKVRAGQNQSTSSGGDAAPDFRFVNKRNPPVHEQADSFSRSLLKKHVCPRPIPQSGYRLALVFL